VKSGVGRVAGLLGWWGWCWEVVDFGKGPPQPALVWRGLAVFDVNK